MIKKKVIVKSKVKEADIGIKTPTQRSRVYNLKPKAVEDKSYIINNIVTLNIRRADIAKLEESIACKGLLHDIGNVTVPVAWNDSSRDYNMPLPVQPALAKISKDSSHPSLPACPARPECPAVKNPFKSLIKKPVIESVQADKPTRKDLIINTFVKRSSRRIMNIYKEGWPETSTYACWYCCHNFDGTPVGIPKYLVNDTFHCYGNFCSYNCAKRYLRPQTEDDLGMIQSSYDTFIGDDLGEQTQLLELMCHIETSLPFDQSIKPAPSRLTLEMFGGDKTISEYRENFNSNQNYHVFRSPLVPISYQMEECVDKTERRKSKNVSIDTLKIEKAFSELAEKSKKSSLKKKYVKA